MSLRDASLVLNMWFWFVNVSILEKDPRLPLVSFFKKNEDYANLLRHSPCLLDIDLSRPY